MPIGAHKPGGIQCERRLRMLPIRVNTLQGGRLRRAEPIMQRSSRSRRGKRGEVLGPLSTELHEVRRVPQTSTEEASKQLRRLIFSSVTLSAPETKFCHTAKRRYTSSRNRYGKDRRAAWRRMSAELVHCTFCGHAASRCQTDAYPCGHQTWRNLV